MLCFSLSSLYHQTRLSAPVSTSTTSTFIMGEPTSPTSMTGPADAALCCFLAFVVPSRLIRIIGLQNSLGPTLPPPPTARRSARLTPPRLPEAAQFFGTG